MFTYHFNRKRINEELYVDLRLIDDGRIYHEIHDYEIFQLNDEFKDFPSQVIDLHLIGVVPADLEEDWARRVTKDVVDKIESYEVETKPFIRVEADVLFSLKNAILVKQLMIKEKQFAHDNIVFSVKTFLIKGRYGIENKEAINRLVDVATNMGEYLIYFSANRFNCNCSNVFSFQGFQQMRFQPLLQMLHLQRLLLKLKRNILQMLIMIYHF